MCLLTGIAPGPKQLISVLHKEYWTESNEGWAYRWDWHETDIVVEIDVQVNCVAYNVEMIKRLLQNTKCKLRRKLGWVECGATNKW